MSHLSPTFRAGDVDLVLGSYLIATILAKMDEGLERFMSFSCTDTQLISPSMHYDMRLLESLRVSGYITQKNDNKLELTLVLPEEFKSPLDCLIAIERALYSKDLKSTETELLTLCVEISVYESIGYLCNILQQHRLPFRLGVRTYKAIEWALNFYSVGQINSLLWSAVKSEIARVQSGQCKKYHAANSVVGSFERLVQQANQYDWNVSAFKRAGQHPQSCLSRVVFNQLLKVQHDGYAFIIKDV